MGRGERERWGGRKGEKRDTVIELICGVIESDRHGEVSVWPRKESRRPRVRSKMMMEGQ